MPATHTVYALWRTRADHSKGEERSVSVWFESAADANACFEGLCRAVNVTHIMQFDRWIGMIREQIRQHDGTMKETPRRMH